MTTKPIRILSIHDDISLIRFVIPGSTEPAPYSIRGNPVFFWIPAGVYPVPRYGAGMMAFAMINVAVSNRASCCGVHPSTPHSSGFREPYIWAFLSSLKKAIFQLPATIKIRFIEGG
jgi:hypothetical protein